MKPDSHRVKLANYRPTLFGTAPFSLSPFAALGVFALGASALGWLGCGGTSHAIGVSGGDGGPGTGPGSPGFDAGGGPSGPLPCAVDQILANHCRLCHQNPPLYGAPMPLVTLADLHAPTPTNTGTPVYTTVGVRTHDDAKPMPPQPNARLSASEQATLDAWIANGAPAGDGSACSAPVADGGAGTTDSGGSSDAGGPPPTDCVPDTLIRPTSAYTMLNQEQYACYGFDIPAGPKRHVTQIQVHLDNKAIVHHVLLLESPNTTSGTPIDCSAAPGLGQPMFYAWAPGGNPLVLPPEAGFPQDQTTHYLVQIHYNNAAGLKAPMDSTGFDLCTTSTLRKYDADVVAFGTENINVPANGSSTSTACYTIGSGLAGRTFFSAFPHMHKLGTTISTELIGDAGAPVDMGAIAHWQFSDQPWLPISVVANQGNVVRTSCSWNNPGPTAVTFGEYTTDEMCFSFSAYYPKADSSIGWFGPSTLSVACQ